MNGFVNFDIIRSASALFIRKAAHGIVQRAVREWIIVGEIFGKATTITVTDNCETRYYIAVIIIILAIVNVYMLLRDFLFRNVIIEQSRQRTK